MLMKDLPGKIYRRPDGPEMGPTRNLETKVEFRKRANPMHDRVLKLAGKGPVTSLKVSTELNISLRSAVQILQTLERHAKIVRSKIKPRSSASGNTHVVWLLK
jgi:hypothetical protein